MILTNRKKQMYLEALERMLYKPRSQASRETIQRMIERIKYEPAK
jgi:hypothetical protein